MSERSRKRRREREFKAAKKLQATQQTAAALAREVEKLAAAGVGVKGEVPLPEHLRDKPLLPPTKAAKMDYAALMNPAYGLTPEILADIGKRNAAAALDPHSDARLMVQTTRNVLKMVEHIRDADPKMGGGLASNHLHLHIEAAQLRKLPHEELRRIYLEALRAPAEADDLEEA